MRVLLDELVTGCEAFEERERRDAMYRVGTELIQQSWGDGGKVADALDVLLLTWNQAFYRYGVLDFDGDSIALRLASASSPPFLIWGLESSRSPGLA